MCKKGQIPEQFLLYGELVPTQNGFTPLYEDMIGCYCRYYPHVSIQADEKIIYCCYPITLKNPGEVISYFEFRLPSAVRKVIGIGSDTYPLDSTQQVDQKLALLFNANKDFGGIYYLSTIKVNQLIAAVGGYTPLTIDVNMGGFVSGWIKDLSFIADIVFPYTVTIIFTCVAKRKYSSNGC